MKVINKVSFNLIYPFKLAGRNKLKKAVRELFEFENKRLGSLEYIFCSDEYLLTINKQFLDHDEYTDIITFDLSDTTASIAGEVYISVERVTENARLYDVPFENELTRVMFHGALHLCGYKDKTPKEKLLMTGKENYYLSQSGL